MNNYELQAKYLKLKNFLNSISDISYAYKLLKEQAFANRVPVDIQIKQLEELAQQARLLLKEEIKQ